MNNIVDYQIFSGYTAEELSSKVEIAISEGWQPQGGITVDKVSIFYQAMVKTDDEPKGSSVYFDRRW